MSETYNPLRQSAQADKFQVFEQWLRDNGAQFPLLELRQYDASADRACETEVDDDGDGDGEGANEEKKESSPSPPLPPGNDGSSEMRSVHATAAIPPQTTVVSIPKRCLITVEMGQATPIGRKILSSSLELDAPKHIFLMIYLLWDRKVRGPSSFFHPYYAILPTSLRNMPVFWTDDELRLLRGSHLLHQIRDRIDAIDDDYRAICALCPEFPAVASREEFRWARMIVCSRNFGLLVDGRRTSALVPHADMLNHRRPRETKWTFDDETQCFTITTLREMEAGEQVYDSYGQKCNHRFLLNYGFAVEDNREVDGFCPNEVPLELGLDLCWGLDEDDEEAEGEEKDEGRMGAKVGANAGKAKERAKKGWNSPEERECWEKKLAFWTRGESAAQYGDSSGNIGGDVGLSSSFQALAAAVAGTTGRGGGMSASIAGAISAMNDASSSSLNDCDMTSVATSGAGMAPSNATAAGHARNGGAATNISNNSNYIQNANHPHHNNIHQNHANTPPPTRPAICPVKRIRVCVSNNENTRILFSMLRVLACTSSELDQIAWGTRLRNPNSNPAASSSPFYGSAATSTAHRLLGLAPPHSSPPSSALRTCRDVRHPLSLSNERRAMRLLLRITTRALAAYPTTLARDVADLKDLRAYPRYSNRRHAKVQVKGEKEVLHHFALWARTAMHVMDIIGHELERERREVMLRFSEAGILCGGCSGGGGGGGGKESVVAAASAGAAARSDDDNDTRELGYDYVIQAMEDDDDCHTTILRYCSDVLGAVRRDELNRIATDAAIRSKIGGNWTRTS